MTVTISLPDEIQAQLEAAARADGKSVGEVYEEAAKRYLAHRDLDDLAARGRSYAQKLNRKPSDVLRLIDEMRRDH